MNLPARIVVLKNTTMYNLGKIEDYPEAQVLQMIGRAGRPQFDDRGQDPGWGRTAGTAVIMTRASTKAKYESLVSGLEHIESSLHENLIEHLNAEVVLYVRVLKNPQHYGPVVECGELIAP